MKIDLFGDVKNWCAISCPVDGLRFDARTLAFLDSDGDGHIRTPEVLAAVEFMKSKGVEPEELLRPASPETESRLADVLAREKDLASVEPSRAEIDALAEWEAKGRTREVAILGDDTASAEASLAAVEKVIDGFFTPLEDMPLVTEEPEAELPLGERINPKFADAVAEHCTPDDRISNPQTAHYSTHCQKEQSQEDEECPRHLQSRCQRLGRQNFRTKDRKNGHTKEDIAGKNSKIHSEERSLSKAKKEVRRIETEMECRQTERNHHRQCNNISVMGKFHTGLQIEALLASPKAGHHRREHIDQPPQKKQHNQSRKQSERIKQHISFLFSPYIPYPSEESPPCRGNLPEL